MVQLQVKRGEERLFCWEISLAANISDTVQQLVEVHNLLTLCRKLGAALETELSSANAAEAAAATYAEALKLLKGALAEAERMQPTSATCLLGVLDPVRAVLDDLSDADPIRRTVDSMHSAEGAVTQCGPDALEASATMLWFAGKAMQPGKQLHDYLGRNEKTKAVVNLQPSMAGAPPREPAVDANTQQAMMAWYYKRQEEQQRLAAEDTGATEVPAWASSNALKQHFTGVSSIRTRI